MNVDRNSDGRGSLLSWARSRIVMIPTSTAQAARAGFKLAVRLGRHRPDETVPRPDPTDTNEITIRISKVLEREESEGWAGVRLVTVTNHDGPDTVVNRTLCVGVSGVDDVLSDVVRDL